MTTIPSHIADPVKLRVAKHILHGMDAIRKVDRNHDPPILLCDVTDTRIHMTPLSTEDARRLYGTAFPEIFETLADHKRESPMNNFSAFALYTDHAGTVCFKALGGTYAELCMHPEIIS